jgi:NTF2 fold immunity protein
MKSFVIILAATVAGYAAPSDKFEPNGGFVPDAETAIKIAVAVWTPIYGAEHIAGEKPYHATLKDGVWMVEGSLPPEKPGEFIVGGVALARISQKDGCILEVIHGQ